MRRTSRLVLAAMVVCLVALGFTSIAGAGSGSSPVLLVRSVDSTDPAATELQFLYTGAAGDAENATLVENGGEVDISGAVPLADTTEINIALLFDISRAMDIDGALVRAKDAAKELVRNRGPEEQSSVRFAVYTMGGSTVQLQTLTNNTDRLLTAIDNVAPSAVAGEDDLTSLWSGLTVAATDLGAEDGQGNIIVMTSQSDNVGGDASVARGAVASSHAAVFAVEYTGDGFNASTLNGIVADNGAQVLATSDPAEMGTQVAAAGATVLDGQFQIDYSSGLENGQVAELELTVGESRDTVSAVVGAATVGKQALHAESTSAASGIAVLQTPLGLLVSIILVVAAAAGIAYALMLIFIKDDGLSSVLQPYAEPSGPDDADDQQSSLASSALLQRAVELTEQVASDRGMLARTEAALERANLPLRAGEALFFYLAAVVVLTILMIVLTGSLFLGIVVGFLASLIPVGAVSFIASRRKKKFMALLPDTLQLLSGTLRAGYSLMQGVEAVSQEVEEPMGLELRRVVTEARLGRPLEEALDGTAQRMDSPDFAWAVMAIRIQREVGGNLSELLMTVADTMTARERLRRDVAALTAEGRVSAIVLGILPVGLAFAMYVLNPDYIGRLFDTTIGNVMLGVSIVSMLIGFFWMKKIIDIEI